MRRPHANVATVLVDPVVLPALEMELAGIDLWVWRVAEAPGCPDGPRMAFQIRHRMVQARRGAWDDAADWTPVWVSFGESWYDGAEPLSWSAHATLWAKLAEYADHTRYRLGLGGVPTAMVRPQAELSEEQAHGLGE